MASRDGWTREQLIAAFTLYCQLPFGRLHSRNPDIITLANAIGRTPGAIALKLGNFASLDPAIRASGRSGMSNASKLDQEIWNEFHANWNDLAIEGSQLIEELGISLSGRENDQAEQISIEVGRTREAVVQIRLRQSFFRRSVLSTYRGRCCMSGIADERLLTASHIVPWVIDEKNRLNPSNGLCLSALHDRAFDRFLITVSPEGTIRVHESLKHNASEIMQAALLSLDGKQITLPDRFAPDASFLQWHHQQFEARL